MIFVDKLRDFVVLTILFSVVFSIISLFFDSIKKELLRPADNNFDFCLKLCDEQMFEFSIHFVSSYYGSMDL